MYLKILKGIAGVLLIIVGIIGLFLPVIPGTLLVIAGLLILGVKRETMKKCFGKLKSWITRK